jgi:hypothetical protein
MALPKWMDDMLNGVDLDSKIKSHTPNKPVETRPFIQPKNAPKWSELSLQEQTNRFIAMKQHFVSKGRSNLNLDDITRLCEANFSPASTDLEMYLNGLVSVDDLTGARRVEPEPRSIENTLTAMCRQAALQAQIDEGKRQQLLNSLNTRPEPTEMTRYAEYY